MNQKSIWILYVSEELDKFPFLAPANLDNGLVDPGFGAQDRPKQIPEETETTLCMCPFQCDQVCLHEHSKAVPVLKEADSLLLMCIRDRDSVQTPW